MKTLFLFLYHLACSTTKAKFQRFIAFEHFHLKASFSYSNIYCETNLINFSHSSSQQEKSFSCENQTEQKSIKMFSWLRKTSATKSIRIFHAWRSFEVTPRVSEKLGFKGWTNNLINLKAVIVGKSFAQQNAIRVKDEHKICNPINNKRQFPLASHSSFIVLPIACLLLMKLNLFFQLSKNEFISIRSNKIEIDFQLACKWGRFFNLTIGIVSLYSSNLTNF